MRIPSTTGDRERFISSQTGEIADYFGRYFHDLLEQIPGQRPGVYSWLHLPYWKILPAALNTRRHSGRRRDLQPARFLQDVQWGQYCAYLFIRLQDDIFDGQLKNPMAIYASDQCLFEADRIFAKYFAPQSWFWREYRECLRLTTQSIVEVDTLQRKRNSKPDELLEGYARVSAILKVGSAAVCANLTQKNTYKKISLFCDEMAKAGQIMDDLRDVEEDMSRKRCNYVGNVLRRSEKKMPRPARSNEMLNRLRVLATTEQIYEEVKMHVLRASGIIAPLKIPEMKKYIAHYLSRVSMFT